MCTKNYIVVEESKRVLRTTITYFPINALDTDRRNISEYFPWPKKRALIHSPSQINRCFRARPTSARVSFHPGHVHYVFAKFSKRAGQLNNSTRCDYLHVPFDRLEYRSLCLHFFFFRIGFKNKAEFPLQHRVTRTTMTCSCYFPVYP